MQPLTLSFDSPVTLVIVGVTAFVAGLVRGFAGFGGPALMMLVLTNFYTPLSVIPKVLVMDAVAGAHLIRGAFSEVEWGRVMWMSLGTLVAMPLGFFALYYIDPVVAKRLVAVVVAASTIAMFFGFRFKDALPGYVWCIAGFAAGFLIGLTGIAMLGMVFLFALPGEAKVSRANAVAWLIVGTPPMLVMHGFVGTLTLDDAWRAALAGLVYMTGAHLGALRFRASSEQLFRTVVISLLLFLSFVGLAT